MNHKKKLAFIIPFFGTWPAFTNLFLLGCEKNRQADFLLCSENSPSFPLPENVRHIAMNNGEIQTRFEKSLGMKLGVIPGHKLCDFRPFFGLAFADLLKGYSFWGYCDVDMMFGDLNHILNDPALDSADIFSAHHRQFVGHCTFLRNCAEVNRLGFEIHGIKDLLLNPATAAADEERFSRVLENHPEIRWIRPGSLDVELAKPFCRHAITYSFRGKLADVTNSIEPVVKWQNGKIQMEWAENNQTEILYVHFMAIKHPWHWSKEPSGEQPNGEAHVFSKLGYGWITHSRDLRKIQFQVLYRLQCALFYLKVFSGRILRRYLSPDKIRNIRKAVRI